MNMTFFKADSIEIYGYCRKQFKKPECQSESIKLIRRVSYASHSEGNETQVIIFTPQAYNYHTIQTFRSSFLELLANLGGTITLWIGVSLYDLKQLVQLFQNKLEGT